MTIRNIAIHHAGGFQMNAYASSRHLSFDDINEAHKQRWNFPSQHIPGQYGGYNFIYDPKTRKFHQYRAIGEETAAQKGFNFDTVSICIIGNYSINPRTRLPVDKMEEFMEEDIASFIYKLINQNFDSRDGIYIIGVTGTNIDLSVTRVHPHRFYQSGTECYGSALSDNWMSTILSRYKQNPDTKELETRGKILQELVKLYIQLKTLLQQREAQKRSLKAYLNSEHACEGMIDLTY